MGVNILHPEVFVSINGSNLYNNDLNSDVNSDFEDIEIIYELPKMLPKGFEALIYIEATQFFGYTSLTYMII